MIRNPGSTSFVREKRAVCSTDNTIVTNTILRILREGGNAIDATIAGCIVQATVEPFMTNHTGSVTCLYYEARSGELYGLDSYGTVPHDLPLFKPVPALDCGLARSGFEPSACIPGFMPGMKALYERFGSKPWESLVEEAIYWAEEGHPVSSFELLFNAWALDFITYFPEGRALYAQGGFLPSVGSRFRNPQLARTLRALAKNGPDHFITGEWARHFIDKANLMGWEIEPAHMTATPPRWGAPVRYKYHGYELAHLPLPQRQGVFCALALGIVDNVAGGSAPADSAEAIYVMAHALRIAAQLCGFVNDPEIFEVPVETWLDPTYHKHLASLVEHSRPRVDLTNHVEKTWGAVKLGAAGLPFEKAEKNNQPSGSCELAVVDADGNWVQMMNTSQSGGIPGQVIDGVPMIGSHATAANMASAMDTWLAPGARMRSVIGNTIALRDGKPEFSLGSPGEVHCTVPQVLANLINRQMDYVAAIEAPRMFPLGDDYSLTIESRLPMETVKTLTALGIRLQPELEYDHHMGSFQVAWREQSGMLGASADLRRCGVADGI
jgi:gamma-glutamyltranspeptidase / glutathione hydrolase